MVKAQKVLIPSVMHHHQNHLEFAAEFNDFERHKEAWSDRGG
jgi:hypothetical protein